MVSYRNKTYTHCRADLMKLVKDQFGRINWSAFWKACDGGERHEVSDEDYRMCGYIGREYRLPVGGCHADAERGVPIWAWIPKPPPIIEFFDSLEFEKRYLFWIGKRKSNCVLCGKEDKWLHFHDVDQPCWTCRILEKDEDAIKGADYFLETLTETIKDERRNERERKRIASRETAE